MSDQSQPAADPKTGIAPVLSVRNAAKAVEFYKLPSGRKNYFGSARKVGAVVAQQSVGAANFWVADESQEHLNFSPESLGGGSVRMVMTVDDPDAAFAQTVAAGATVVSPVRNDYGWRLRRIVDPFGHHAKQTRPMLK